MIKQKEYKPVVLTFARYYQPGYKSGGQLRTLVNMVERLGQDIDFHIVTSDRDLLEFKPYDSVNLDQWNAVSAAKVLYITPAKQKIITLRKIINETKHDLIYLNSFFDPIFTLIPLFLKRLKLIPDKNLIIAPRGELSCGALKTKTIKKRLYIGLAKFLNFYKNIYWQASSDLEAKEISSILKINNDYIKIAPDIPGLTIAEYKMNSLGFEQGIIKIVFLSRISPIKNLIFALEVLKSIRLPVIFDIYGPIDDPAYWIKCKEVIDFLPENIKAEYKGYIKHEEVFQTLNKYDLFFLPTLNENYGHVIHEALAAGLPVLISDKTPWRNLETCGIGWDLPLSDPDKFAEIIEYIANQNKAERVEMRKKALSYASKIANDTQVIKQNRNLFLGLLQ